MTEKKSKQMGSGGGSTLMSMTGFARAQRENELVRIELEIRSVNSRFLDLNFRLPREYQVFEREARQRISQQISRGRVEVSCSRTQISCAENAVRFDQTLLDRYMQHAEQAAKARDIWSKECERALFLEFIGRREILDNEDGVVEIGDEQPIFESVLGDALTALQLMRAEEGAVLEQDLTQRVDELLLLSTQIESHSSDKAPALRAKLSERIARIVSEGALDPQRLELEVALLVDRADISEELVRLKSHLAQFSDVLSAPPNGRKLDFLSQELLREFNTITSKIQEPAAQQLVVEAKSVIEKLKEQVQNVE